MQDQTAFPDETASQGAGLSRALKALRRHRGLRPADVALAMNMPLRSFEHFEAGCGRLNLERIRLFAEVTDTDAYAILASLWIGDPTFAVRCADNKMMTVFVMTLRAFNGQAGADLRQLDARTLFAAFTKAFDGLAEAGAERSRFVDGGPEGQPPKLPDDEGPD